MEPEKREIWKVEVLDMEGKIYGEVQACYHNKEIKEWEWKIFSANGYQDGFDFTPTLEEALAEMTTVIKQRNGR